MSADLERLAQSADRPLPQPNEFSAPFWEACKRHELRLQRCSDCGAFRYYPRPACPACLSREHEWARCSGRGVVYSYTIVHRALTRWFRDQVPVVVAVVELEEGVRMVSNVVEVEPTEVRIGLPVEVTWDDVDETITLPKFRPTP